MIETLTIGSLEVIAEARLGLSAGFTTLTGRTDTGKTMALTSLQFALGRKSDPGHVHTDAEAAQVEGTPLVVDDSPILAAIDDTGRAYDVDGGQAETVVTQQVPASGRSSTFTDGRHVPTAVLRSVAQGLVTVHGQLDQLRLATAAQQRQALDAFGGEKAAKALRQWGEAHSAHAKAGERFRSFDKSAHENARRRLAYQALATKVEEVSPHPGEDEALKAEAFRLENTKSRFVGLSEAAVRLSGSDTVESSAMGGINTAVRALGQTGDVVDPLTRLRSVRDELGDIAVTLASAAANTEADPAKLTEIYARRQGLSGLWRELGMGNDEAIEAVEEARAALADLEDPESTGKRPEEECEHTRKNMEAAGEALHEARSQTAGRLGALVGDELTELALTGARFEITVTEGQPAAHDADVVEFLLASHSGAPLRPIDALVSGGELSRAMLAVKVSFTERATQSGHAFLFDEVSVGVDNQAAQAVGRRLVELAEKHQVIVVTHLTQVAAHAAIQAVIVKEGGESGTKTDVTTVTSNERFGELARMFSGNNTEATRAHVAELLGDGPGVAQ